MLYMTWLYAIFVTVLFLVYWFCIPARFRPWLFTAAGAGLLMYALPAHTILIFCMAIIVFLAGEYSANKSFSYHRLVFVAGVTVVLGILTYYKYSRLITETINQFFHIEVTLPEYAVPLGISFFTFRFISYLIDMNRGEISEHSLGKFLLYTFFFPIIPSGPIERFHNIEQQSNIPGKFQWQYVQEGIPRILWGLFKKAVLADSVSFPAENLWDPNAGAMAYWVGMYAAAMKIYWDFSGYTDIAVGTSRLFGYKITENFNNPYFQTNISKFWKNWHMSLTGWFRDYLFIPLGGSRHGFGTTLRNTLIVMAATGIWHGAAWHFLFWGLYHAAGLIFLRLYNLYISKRLPEEFKQSRIATVLSIGLTFHFVTVGWIFFFVGTRQGLHVLKVMSGF